MRCHCVAAFVCKSTYRDASSFEVKVRALLAISVSLERARSPVNHHIDSGIMFVIVLIKEIHSLFAMGIFNKKNPVFIDGSVH